MKKSIIRVHGSSDNEAQTNSGQGLKRNRFNFYRNNSTLRGPGSSVGIATDYEIGGLGIESWRGQDFPHLSRLALGPTKLPVQWVPGFSWG
jgi:hypothetical protein